MNPCDHERPRVNVYEVPNPRTIEWQIAVMQAAASGQPLEWRSRLQVTSHPEFTVWRPFQQGPYTHWDWNRIDYRIRPEERPKKLVPWTHETFPREPVWLRAGDRAAATCWRRAVSFTLTGIHMGEHSGQLSYKDLFESGWVYSLDNGKSWSRCGVETESL